MTVPADLVLRCAGDRHRLQNCHAYDSDHDPHEGLADYSRS